MSEHLGRSLHSSPASALGSVAWLRALVLALAAGLLAAPLTPAAGLLATLLGAVAGALIGQRASYSRLRLGAALGLAAVAAGLGLGVARLAVGLPAVAKLLGPALTFTAAESVRWLALSASLVFVLRFLAARRAWAAVLEVGLVALSLALTLAAHRGGRVHRPHLLADWAWSRGIDPVLVLLVLGGIGTLVLAALLVREHEPRRLPLHFSALALLALVFLFLVRMEGLPQPDGGGDLGLTGEPQEEEAEPQDGGGRGRSGGEAQKGQQLGDLEFKDEYDQRGGESPVAVAVLHDDYSPPPGVFYFRQSAFSQYNGRRLVQATRDDVDRDILHRFPAEPSPIKDAPPLSRERRALDVTVGLLVDHVQPFALDSPAEMRPTPNPSPVRFQRAFAARSHVQVLPYEQLVGRRPGDRDWEESQWQHYTEAPSDSRYSELADELAERLLPQYRDDPLGKALAIKAYLDENGIYSLKSRHAGASDPAASFLFGDLTGYCVHFAHAATYLLRSLGVPSRVAAGYAIPEAARGGGSALLIRGANAHAWPEIYLDEVGWVVVDLAPEQSLDDPVDSPDPGLQRMLGEMLRQDAGEQPTFEEQLAQTLNWRRILQALLLLLASALLVAYVAKCWRRLAPRLSAPEQLYRVGYRAALDRLGEVGLRRRRGESRERFALRAASLAPAIGPLTDGHLGWALGSRHRLEPQQLRQLQQRLGEELQSTVPGWRRGLGLLDPLSWMRTR